MTVEGTTASFPEELVVSVEQANALVGIIGTREGDNALSSAMPVSGLMAAGLADSTGLTGDAEAILGPARTVDSRLAIRVVSPRPSIGVRNVRIWPSRPRSVVMRAEDDGVHFTQVDSATSRASWPRRASWSPGQPSTTDRRRFLLTSCKRCGTWTLSGRSQP